MDIEAIKNSMVVLVAKNEQSNMHITSRFQLDKIHWLPYTLHFCDYTFMIPKNADLGITEDISFENIVAVERKANLTEIAGNFCKGRKRFENEFCRAVEAGCKVHLVIEDEKAREKMIRRREEDILKKSGVPFVAHKTWKSFFCANSMIASISAFKERYGLKVAFVKKTDMSGYMIELFEREIEKYFTGGIENAESNVKKL